VLIALHHIRQKIRARITSYDPIFISVPGTKIPLDCPQNIGIVIHAQQYWLSHCEYLLRVFSLLARVDFEAE
jgi:hypothetical protein